MTATCREGRSAGLVALLLAAIALAQPVAAQPANAQSESLVLLRNIDPSIVQDIRYATADNFTGARLPGYDAAECLLTRTTAAALARVQADLLPAGLALKVYDCYRPQRATRAMVAWVKTASAATSTSPHYHPSVPRGRLLTQGYIASLSAHARGDTVDLTLVPREAVAPPHGVPAMPQTPCTGPADARPPDTSVDMGTGFDCLDPKSNTHSTLVSAEQRRWRTLLLRAMQRHGFVNYTLEWWHFTHRAGGGKRYDVPISARP